MMTKAIYSRRAMLLGAAAFAALPAFAVSTQAARSFVDQSLAELQSMMNSGASGAALQQRGASFFRKYSDVPTIARSVIGSTWRDMSSKQQAAYVAAFEGYVVRKYTRMFKDLRGGTPSVTGEQTIRGGIMVDAQFVWSGEKPYRLQFHIKDYGGRPKIVDLKIKGISLVSNERGSIRSLLSSSNQNIDEFITKLTKVI